MPPIGGEEPLHGRSSLAARNVGIESVNKALAVNAYGHLARTARSWMSIDPISSTEGWEIVQDPRARVTPPTDGPGVDHREAQSPAEFRSENMKDSGLFRYAG